MKEPRIKLTVGILIVIILAFLVITFAMCLPIGQSDDQDAESMAHTSATRIVTSKAPATTAESREMKPVTTEATTESSSETETETETGTETSSESAPAHPDMTNARRIWVGDSRIVGLTESGIGDPGKDVFIGKFGRYYVWFNNDALPVLRSLLDTGEPFEVLIQIGVNDCANTQMHLLPYFASDYAVLINSLIDEYPNARFWFLSVGEVIGTYGGGTQWEVKMEDLNPLVESFNETIKAECRATYLPVGEFIKAEHKTYRDNVHYSPETNWWIYNYTLQCIQQENEAAIKAE